MSTRCNCNPGRIFGGYCHSCKTAVEQRYLQTLREIETACASRSKGLKTRLLVVVADARKELKKRR